MPVIIVLFVVWLLSFFFPVENLAVSSTSPWWTLFTYSFVHSYFLHLLVNSFVFWTYYRVMRKSDVYYLIPSCILIPTISGYLSAKSVPTCGFSSVISVMMGYYLSGCSRKIFVKALFLILFSYVFTGLFSKGVNTLIHVYSFSFSYITSVIYRKLCCLLQR